MIAYLRQHVLTSYHDYENPIERQRAAALLIILWFLLLGALMADVAVLVPGIINRGHVLPSDGLFILVPPMLLAFSIFLIHRGNLEFASVLVVVLTMPLTLAALAATEADGPMLLQVMLPIVLSGLLLNRRQTAFVAALMLVFTAAIAYVQTGGITGERGLLLASLWTIVIVTVLFVIFSGVAERMVTDAVLSTETFSMMGQFLDRGPYANADSLFTAMIDEVRRQDRYAFAQVFLTNEKGDLDRRMRSGMRLGDVNTVTPVQIGDANALSEAAGSHVTVAVSRDDGPARRGHFLPTTRYALALPVVIEGQTVAVLDVQNNDEPFNDASQSALELLVRQAAWLLSRQRTLDALRTTINEQQTAIASLRRDNEKYRADETHSLSDVWQAYLAQRSRAALGYDLVMQDEAVTLIAADDLPDDLPHSLADGAVHVAAEGDHQRLYVPILVQGQILGVMIFRIEQETPLDERQIEFAQSVTIRLGLALENKRLFEQSQMQAWRERKASEVANTLIRAVDVDGVLELAADSFKDALGAIQARIQLDTDALATTPDQAAEPVLSSPVETQGDNQP